MEQRGELDVREPEMVREPESEMSVSAVGTVAADEVAPPVMAAKADEMKRGDREGERGDEGGDCCGGR